MLRPESRVGSTTSSAYAVTGPSRACGRLSEATRRAAKRVAELLILDVGIGSSPGAGGTRCVAVGDARLSSTGLAEVTIA